MAPTARNRNVGRMLMAVTSSRPKKGYSVPKARKMWKPVVGMRKVAMKPYWRPMQVIGRNLKRELLATAPVRTAAIRGSMARWPRFWER